MSRAERLDAGTVVDADIEPPAGLNQAVAHLPEQQDSHCSVHLALACESRTSIRVREPGSGSRVNREETCG